MHVCRQMFRGEITVRRYDRSSCLICQSEGWHSTFSFTASENINQTSVIWSPHRKEKHKSCKWQHARTASQPSEGQVTFSRFGPRRGVWSRRNKKLIMLWAAFVSRLVWEDGEDEEAASLLQQRTQRQSERPAFHGQSLRKLKRSHRSPHWDARACTLCSEVDYKISSCLVWSFNPVVFMTWMGVQLGSLTYCVLLDGMSILQHWFIAISNQNHLRTWMSDYVDGLISSWSRNMHRNIKLQRAALQAEREHFILADVSRKGSFFGGFFPSADVCYPDLKMIYGKSSAEASWSSTNLKRPRRWGHYLHAASSAPRRPHASPPRISFQNDCSQLSFLSVIPEKTSALSFFPSFVPAFAE